MIKEQIREYNKKYRAAYNKAEKDEIKEYNAQLYQKNKEQHLEKCHSYHKENKGKISSLHQEYYKIHSDAFKVASNLRYINKRGEIEAYKEANKEKIATTQKAYKIAHAEEIKKWSQEYNKRPEQIYKIYKRAAKRRNISFNLTYEQFLIFWQKPCFYCGLGIETIGLDRVDNSKGYEMTNVVPCCKICNYMKADMSQEKFLEHVRLIAF